MKNKIGFIPKTWEVQPDYYRNIFNHWAAIFIVDDGTTLGKEYHLQLDGGCIHSGCKEANRVEILRQDKDLRRPVYHQPFTSIKQAYSHLLPKLKNNQQ